MSVLLLEGLEMIKFVLEGNNLVFKLNDLTFTVYKLGFLILEVVGLGVDEFVQVINSSELFGNIVLEGSSLGSKVSAFLALKIILVVELIDFLSILSVSISQILKFSFQMFFLCL